MLKQVGIAVVVVLVGLVAFVATRPSTFHVERSAQIAAPPEVVYALVSDFHRWAQWSPWERRDPAMKKTFEGPPAGQGAGFSWAGNDQVGEGRQTITLAKPPERIEIKLAFLKPFPSTSEVTFTFAPDAGGVRVTWAMDGHHNFAGKAFSLVMDMDKMIGGDFTEGLGKLKSVAEAEAKEKAAAPAAPPAAPAAPAIRLDAK